MNSESEGSLEALQDEWLELSERDEAPSQERFIVAHPEHAEALRAWFATMEMLDAVLAGGERHSSPSRIGRYDIVRELGRGAMGVVYEARDPDLGRNVALKTLSPLVAGNDRAVRRFETEARAAARIKHPNLVPIHEVGSDHGLHYYVMELVDGRSLEQEIEALRAENRDSLVALGRPGLDDYLTRFAGVCRALHAAHEQRVLHRDVKPSNILVAADGTMKLVDFGLAREDAGAGLTRTGELMGTPMYMSPEQVMGSLAAMDARSDVFSLGITLYELVMLRPPYPESSVVELTQKILTIDPAPPRALGIRVPAELEAIIYKAIEKDPLRRYGSAEALAADIESFIALRPVAASPQTALVRLRKRLKRNKPVVRAALLSLLGAILVATLIVGIPFARGYLREREVDAAKEAREADARALWRKAAAEAPQPAIDLLARIRDEFDDTALYVPALHRLGELRREVGDREGAQVEWAAAYAAAPHSREGVRALIDLGRTLQDVGRLALAADAAETALTSASGTERGLALLLAAEAFLPGEPIARAGVDPRTARGLGYLQACEAALGDLPPRAQQRLSQLGRVVRRFLPAEQFKLGPSRLLQVGTFWKEGDALQRGLLIAHADTATFHPITSGGVGESGRFSWKLLGPNSGLAAVDILGDDGVLEVIEISYDDDKLDNQVLRIYELGAGGERLVFEQSDLALPTAHYVVRAADVNADGVAELVLGRGHPGEGVDVLRFGEDGQLVRMQPGALAELSGGQAENNVRDLVLEDLDQDGRMEMAVACAEHRVFELKLYTYDAGWRSIDLAPGPHGSMSTCVTARVPGDPFPRLVFAPYAYFGEQVAPLYPSFLPQGYHQLSWSTSTRSYALSALDVTERLSVVPRGGRNLLPWSIGSRDLVSGVLPSGGGFLAAWETSGRVRQDGSRYVVLRPYGAVAGRGFILRRPKEAAHLRVVDWDGDGFEELLLKEMKSGVIHVHGLGSMPRADPAPTRATRGARGGGLSTRFEAAAMLLRLGFADLAARAYAKLREEVRGGPLEERAFLGMISAWGRAGRLDECVVELERWRRAGMDASRRALLKLADCALKLGRLEDAVLLYTEASQPGLIDADAGVRAARAAEALDAWRVVPRPKPLQRSAWTQPSGPAFDAIGGGLRHVSAVPAPEPVWIREPWSGESFRLAFDLRVAEMGVGRNLSVGFLDPRPGRHPLATYLAARVGSTSGQYRSVSVASKKADEPSHTGREADTTPGKGLPAGRPFRFTLTYEPRLRRAWLTVRELLEDARPGPLYCALELDVREPLEGPLRLGIGAGHAEWKDRLSYSISNLALWRPDDRR